MEVHERALPGVGHKYTLRPEAGGELVVVIHHSGKRELLYLADEDSEPRMALELNDLEAREVGAILAGVMFQPEAVGDVATRIASQAIEWHQLPVGSQWIGHSVGELEQDDVHVLAILRDDDVLIPKPDPDTRLRASDTVVVAGSRGAVAKFRSKIASDPA